MNQSYHMCEFLVVSGRAYRQNCVTQYLNKAQPKQTTATRTHAFLSRSVHVQDGESKVLDEQSRNRLP